ncbi:MAG: cytochrome C oxidase subunit II [Bacilli bacterium]
MGNEKEKDDHKDLNLIGTFLAVLGVAGVIIGLWAFVWNEFLSR